MTTGLAHVALGSNLADPLEQLRSARRELSDLGRVVACSSIYRTAPVGGPSGQPDYLNAVLALRPGPGFGDPLDLLGALHRIEQRHGRLRRLRWEARVLDLDLLSLGDLVRNDDELVLPHPRLTERAFVLAPLCEATPEWRHPVGGEGACELLQRLSQSGVERTELAWGDSPGTR